MRLPMSPVVHPRRQAATISPWSLLAAVFSPLRAQPR